MGVSIDDARAVVDHRDHIISRINPLLHIGSEPIPDGEPVAKELTHASQAAIDAAIDVSVELNLGVV